MGAVERSGPLTVGDVFLGKYKVLGVVGQGGFGCVYRATNLFMGREVALKVLDRPGGLTEELRHRGQRLDPCYAPVTCTGELGQGLNCEGVAQPDNSVYECEGYRLPTRSEAEYAARAGTISTWYSGNITVYDNNDCNFDENLDKIGWYCFNSGDRAHVRGQKLVNGFGLADMVGNVAEWTSEADRQEGASGGQDPAGFIGTSKDRLAFGGMYNADAWTACRTAGLFAAPWDFRGYRTGFRLYRTLFEDSERSKAIVEP